MKIVKIKDIEGCPSSEGTIKPLLFTEMAGVLYLELPTGIDVTPHSHPQDAILYCIEGVIEISSDDGTTTVSADSVVFKPANEVTGIKNPGDRPAKLLSISIPPVAKSEEDFKELLKRYRNDN